jgi:hypothetical protein
LRRPSVVWPSDLNTWCNRGQHLTN